MSLTKAYNFILHFAGWLVFFLLVLSISPRPGSHFHLPRPPYPPFFILLFPLLSGFYYLNQLVLIPGLLAIQKRWLYIFSIFICCTLLLCLPLFERELIQLVLPHRKGPPEHVVTINFLITSLLFLLVFIFSSGSKIVTYWMSAENLKKDMEFEKTLTELSFLKAQINPHFLFNTLNNIYTLSILKSEKAADAVLKLADMMRYVLSDIAEKEVSIDREIEYIEKFIALQKMRLTELVTVDFQVFGHVENQKIAPLILLPFIENAFKFGVSTQEKSYLKIHIIFKNNNIVLQVENQTFDVKISKNLSTGTGLKNVKRRLELLYPRNHWLRIEKTDNKFFVDLSINL